MRQYLRQLAWWILGHVHPTLNEVDMALKGAFLDCGLNPEVYTHDFDLVAAGKLHEVIIHGAKRLGNPLTTVRDVRELLR